MRNVPSSFRSMFAEYLRGDGWHNRRSFNLPRAVLTLAATWRARGSSSTHGGLYLASRWVQSSSTHLGGIPSWRNWKLLSWFLSIGHQPVRSCGTGLAAQARCPCGTPCFVRMVKATATRQAYTGISIPAASHLGFWKILRMTHGLKDASRGACTDGTNRRGALAAAPEASRRLSPHPDTRSEEHVCGRIIQFPPVHRHHLCVCHRQSRTPCCRMLPCFSRRSLERTVSERAPKTVRGTLPPRSSPHRGSPSCIRHTASAEGERGCPSRWCVVRTRARAFGIAL
mmetsp:Transcript_36561/g.97436  ORF Transcript_36561/g.97436 Transcript_36561/m.97436 type:complete len:284 (-) Transcript_36561:101-952(-)